MNGLENIDQYRIEFDTCFKTLKEQIDESFIIMDKYPDEKYVIIDMWKARIMEFISYTCEASEKYNNREVFKAITKALIFGK